MSEILKRANEIRFKKDLNLKKYKGLTIREPNEPKYWFKLAICLFARGENSDGWKALCNAKKLGSVEAIELIQKLLTQYGEVSPEASNKALKSLLG